MSHWICSSCKRRCNWISEWVNECMKQTRKEKNQNKQKPNWISVWQIDKCHWVIFAVSLMAIEFHSRNEARKISQIPDWSDAAIAGDHLWQPTSISGDFCYVGETECSVRWSAEKTYSFIAHYDSNISYSLTLTHKERTFWELFSHHFNIHCLRWAFVTIHSTTQY